MVQIYEVPGDGEQEWWVTSCGRILLFERGVGIGYVSYLWEVEYQGLVVSVFRGVGGYPCVCVRVVYDCVWLSQEPMVYGCSCWYVCV